MAASVAPIRGTWTPGVVESTRESSKCACAAIVASSVGDVTVLSRRRDDASRSTRGRGTGEWRVAARLRSRSTRSPSPSRRRGRRVGQPDTPGPGPGPGDTRTMRTVTVARTGATDGTVAAWDLTAVARPSPTANPKNDGATPRLAPAGLPRAHHLESTVWRWRARRVVRPVDSSSPPAATTTFRVAALRVCRETTGWRVRVSLASVATDSARFGHQGVAGRGGMAATTSHDQRLRVWRVDVIEEEACGTVRFGCAEAAAGVFAGVSSRGTRPQGRTEDPGGGRDGCRCFSWSDESAEDAPRVVATYVSKKPYVTSEVTRFANVRGRGGTPPPARASRRRGRTGPDATYRDYA